MAGGWVETRQRTSALWNGDHECLPRCMLLACFQLNLNRKKEDENVTATPSVMIMISIKTASLSGGYLHLPIQ